MRRHTRAKLTDLSFFATWPKDDLSRLTRLGTVVAFEPGEIISVNTTTAREFILLLSGSAVVKGGPDDGRPLGPGDHVGEIAMLTHPAPPATIAAKASTQALVVSAVEFRTLLDTVPSFGRAIATNLARRLVPTAA